MQRHEPIVVQIFQDELTREEMQKRRWETPVSKLIREWKEEDARNNCPWEDEK